MFEFHQPSCTTDARGTVTDELHEEALHVYQVYQTSVHEDAVIPPAQIILNGLIERPFLIKAVVLPVDGIVVETGTIAPLQPGDLPHDPFTGIEAVEQALHLARQVVIVAHGHDIDATYPYFLGETGAAATAQHDA